MTNIRPPSKKLGATMRKAFSALMEHAGKTDKKTIFFTGDLGFMALEGVRESMGDRFVNTGVSEQNMVTAAAAVASEGFTVFCYSIAPFTVFRPAEQIRLDVCLHNKNVKIVGNGGGYGYGIMGGTHHAIEDIAVLSSFQNMRCYIPFCKEDVEGVFNSMMDRVGPAYLRLGGGQKPEDLELPKYSHTRKLTSGKKITVVALGPVTLNALTAISSLNKDEIELFVITEIPIPNFSSELQESIKKTGKLLVVEEHVQRGGLGENLAELVLESGLSCQYQHLFAKGYPNGLYGSQKYHQKLSSLDPDSIKSKIQEMINEKK